MPESFKRLNKANINAITDGAFPNHSRIKCSNVKNKLSNLKRRYLVLKLKLEKVSASNDAAEADKIQKAIARDLPFFEIIDNLMLRPDSPGGGVNSASFSTGTHQLSLSPATTNYILETTGSSTGGLSPNFDDSILESPDLQQHHTSIPLSPQASFKQQMRAARRHSPYNFSNSFSTSRQNSESILAKTQQQASYANRINMPSGTNTATTASSASTSIISPTPTTPTYSYDFILPAKPLETTPNNTENTNHNNNSNSINNNIIEEKHLYSIPNPAVTAAGGHNGLDRWGLDSQTPSHAFKNLSDDLNDQKSPHQIRKPTIAPAAAANTNLISSTNINAKQTFNNSLGSIKPPPPPSHQQALLENLTKYEMQKRLEIEFYKAKEELALKRYETDERLKMEHRLNNMKAQILATQLDKAKAELERISIDSDLAAVELETKRLELERLKQEQKRQQLEQ
ncbi:hypothetical protein D0Z00_003022 [Geotrichum galactomycetum]|uniref:Uncharacterized protein n=1 Tax=Geotrichum galactomycetum TaxID=27317 RepID=A0ACB6V2J4_9ASCO|nr:hypothetical protein D0Z00_003022 [Geotrichum candidum]